MPRFVVPLVIRQGLKSGLGIFNEVDAGAPASASRDNSESFDFGEMLARGLLAVLEEPAEQAPLF